MAAPDEEIVVKLDVSKPLGFRLSQPVASNEHGSTDVSVKILKVRRKSQAFKLGLKSGDIITDIAGYSGKLEYSEVMDYLRQKQNFTNGQQTVVITLKRGREYSDSEPALCITNKPAAAHSTTSTSPTPASGTNVCCLHGVQSKPGYAKGVVENNTSAIVDKKVESISSTKKHEEDKKEESQSGGLFQFFKTTAVSPSDKAPPAPPAPPKAATAGYQSKNEQQQSTTSSWIQKAFQFTDSFTKSDKKEEKTSKSSTIVNGVSPPASSVPYIIKTTPVPPPAPGPPFGGARIDEHLKNQPEPRYPAALGGPEDSSYTSKATLFVRTSGGSSVSQPSPTAAPEVTVGQETVQIHVKPSFKAGHEYHSSSSTYSRASAITDDYSRAAIPTEPSYYARQSPMPMFSPKGDTTTTTVDDEHQSVQKRRRQWPPPSNATGVEVPKDLWVHGTGSVADLDAAGVPESRFESYSATTTTRDFDSYRPSTLPIVPDTADVADELAATVTAAAIRKSKYGEQLSEQVRMCQNIARALKSPVPSPSKAQRMFTKRKDRMEKWVVTTPSSIEEEASSSEVCQTSSSPRYQSFQPVPAVDSFEVIRSTPQNWQMDNYSGSGTVATYDENVPTVPVEHYKKYSRYTYKSTSSYHSAVDDENELHLPKKARNPMGEVRDYETLTKEYGDNIMTNIASPEKSHELAQALTSDSHAGKGVEMFHRRRQKADDWVVDENKIRNTSRSLPPVAPRRHLVDPADVIESVHEAAARKEEMFSPSATSRPVYTPLPLSETHVPHTSLNEMMDSGGVKTPTPAAWGHERLFSPTPFSYATTPRPYTPMDFGGRRTPLPESHYSDYSARPDVTTSVVALSTPSTRIVTTVNQSYTTTSSGDSSRASGFNTLPRSWKSFSSAYKQNYAS